MRHSPGAGGFAHEDVEGAIFVMSEAVMAFARLNGEAVDSLAASARYKMLENVASISNVPIPAQILVRLALDRHGFLCFVTGIDAGESCVLNESNLPTIEQMNDNRGTWCRQRKENKQTKNLPDTRYSVLLSWLASERCDGHFRKFYTGSCGRAA
jgi:hypothetical protein